MNNLKKRVGTAVDIVMYSIMLFQMFYAFTGNALHEIFGILLFACIVIHICLKWKRIKMIFAGSRKKNLSVRFSEIIMLLLLVCVILLALSGMGVSRLLFPWFHVLGDSALHRYLATATADARFAWTR